MEHHAIVIVSLHSPKEKIWGQLLAINPSGVTLRGIDLHSFDERTLRTQAGPLVARVSRRIRLKRLLGATIFENLVLDRPGSAWLPEKDS